MPTMKYGKSAAKRRSDAKQIRKEAEASIKAMPKQYGVRRTGGNARNKRRN